MSLFARIKAFFTRKASVDGIISDIIDKVEQLHAVKDAKHAESAVHIAVAKERNQLAAVALAERNRALAIAEKLTGLIS